ncbi:MAG TPA: diacylglycerol kinase family protein [Ktedonobacteraceae bacterium]|nr:diacylglycerol kinase family protein [Ktedonobacteraceae bacterium]
MPARQQAIVIHSPHSGRSEQLSEALKTLQQAGVDIIQVISIADLDHLPPQGAIWKEQGANVAIAAGGDGLVGGVTMHIAESDLPLGIMPLGTSNDIARTLRIPQYIQGAAEVIAQGNAQEVDIGMAHPAEQAPHRASKKPLEPARTRIPHRLHGYFAHALTVGVNVQFARLATNVATRQRFGRLTYPFAALEVLRNHRPLDVELHFEGLRLAPLSSQALSQAEQESLSTLTCRAVQVTVINAPIFGGQWQLAIPGASMHDRLLDIVVIEDIDPANLSNAVARLFNQPVPAQAQPAQPESLWHLPHPLRNPAELTGVPGIHHVQAQAVTITTSIDPLDATLDGEVRGQTPLEAHVAEQRLKVLVQKDQ